VLTFEDVGIDDFCVMGAGDLILGDVGKRIVNFDRHYEAGTFDKGLGERSGSASYFEHNVVAVYPCRINEHAHQVQVDEEVLAESLVR
jgi:hypothetical protein